MTENINIVKFSSIRKFSGQRKIGLDTGLIVRIIDNPSLYADYSCKLKAEKGVLYTHKVCEGEAVTILVRDYGYSEGQARASVRAFIKEWGVTILGNHSEIMKTYSMIEKKCEKARIEFHDPDSFIIATFYDNRINKAYSGNKHFLDTCKMLGMDTDKVLIEDAQLRKNMREMFKRPQNR